MLDVAELSFVMDEGVTVPINCRLSNGTNVVVKYPNNPGGTSTLINEWIGNNIAQKIGITVPDFGLCRLDTDVIYSQDNIDDLDASNTGICFYSEYMSKAVPLVSKRQILNCEAEKIILLDHILNNFDRHTGNLFYDLNTSILYAIDYSHIFSDSGLRPDYTSEYVARGMNPEAFLYTDIIKKNRTVYEILCYSAGFDETVLQREGERVKSMISSSYLVELFDSLPDDWIKSVSKEKVYRLISFIDFRVSNIANIADMIVKELQR